MSEKYPLAADITTLEDLAEFVTEFVFDMDRRLFKLQQATGTTAHDKPTKLQTPFSDGLRLIAAAIISASQPKWTKEQVWRALEGLEDANPELRARIAALTPSQEELVKHAEKNPPPQSWFDDEPEPFGAKP